MCIMFCASKIYFNDTCNPAGLFQAPSCLSECFTILFLLNLKIYLALEEMIKTFQHNYSFSIIIAIVINYLKGYALSSV